MPHLNCPQITFYSHADEAGFFAALAAIKSIRKVNGDGDRIVISIPSRLSEKALRDLIGVFHRYEIDMTQLRQFETSANREWLRDSAAFWFTGMFRKIATPT
jgi:hypothetical protein